MKRFPLLLFLAFALAGCAHRPPPGQPVAHPAGGAALPQEPPTAPEPPPAPPGTHRESLKEAPPGKETPPPQGGAESAQSAAEAEGEQPLTIADPLEPFNRAMFTFNDRLYFWVLKPVALQYNKVVPETARIGVRNFFYNLRFPNRFASCLFRADFTCVGEELGRFVVNTVWGVGGLLDPASSPQVNLPKRNADMGQTLGVYGAGPGFYLDLPVLGPYTARDSVDIVTSYFLYAVDYISPWYAPLGIDAYETVNATSLRIGDYESLKEAAIDPYVALRDAYIQYRQKMIEAAKGKTAPVRPGGVEISQ